MSSNSKKSGSGRCRLLMLGAMYENGGNTTHRFLDGHPQMFVYPFESQIGTRMVNDRLSSVFPVKYRWPVFDLSATPAQDYHAIIDEEGKVRARTPHVSKFRHAAFDMNDDARRDIFVECIQSMGRTRANLVEAFFKATFDAWKNCKRTGDEQFYVGYSPIIVVDAMKMLEEMPDAHFLHVVRNPWSAYADTKKRPVPHSLDDYFLGWNLNQHYALLAKEKFPDRMHILRTEDIMGDPQKTLGEFCKKLGLDSAPTLSQVSWNGEELQEVYPWGTIRKATPAANKATAMELSPQEQSEIGLQAKEYIETFDFKNFLKS